MLIQKKKKKERKEERKKGRKKGSFDSVLPNLLGK